MKLHFTKMHGAGNDFVVLDGIQTPIDFTPEQWAAIADRHFGVGADQLLLVERSTRPDVDFRYRIFNHDGGEVEHCGNGARCFVKFVTDRGLTDKRTVRVEVMNGIATLTMQDDGRVTVDMGAPVFEAARLPFLPEGLPTRTEGRDTLHALQINGRTEWLSTVSMARELAKAAGIDMRETYWTLGQYDLVVICEGPDDAAMTSFGLALASAGNVRSQTLRAFSADEMNGILSKIP